MTTPTGLKLAEMVVRSGGGGFQSISEAGMAAAVMRQGLLGKKWLQ
jgi:hypothetical protein